LLKKMIEMGGSDLHITTRTVRRACASRPARPLDMPPLTQRHQALAYSVLTDAQKHRFEEELGAGLLFGLKKTCSLPAATFSISGELSAPSSVRFHGN